MYHLNHSECFRRSRAFHSALGLRGMETSATVLARDADTSSGGIEVQVGWD
ncbi:MAG: hypothetical protein GY832_16045 [Chloroflexi bacterium]|nr:hypothetical protein [Chloroflexota bacterium]